jgi:5-enolpyruvylshikimate-3-phosphate synthase
MHSRSSYQSEELFRLWRTYSDSTSRALDIMRIRGTEGDALLEIITELKKAGQAIGRIKQIHGITDDLDTPDRGNDKPS